MNINTNDDTARLRAIALPTLAGALLLSPNAAQQPWELVANSGPAPRHTHCMAFDSARGFTVLFGGSTNTLTWEFDGTSWNSTSAPGPTGRSWAAMAYDSTRGRIVMFGGADVAGQSGETWEWDGATWTLVDDNPAIARSGHAMAFDSTRNRIVMFGGWIPNGQSGFPSGETWEYDGFTSTWTQIPVVGPAPRHHHGMAYDAARGKTVVHAGRGASQWYPDTWEWDGSSWAYAAASGAGLRYGFGICFDSVRNKTVMFGGGGGGGDTWQWDGVGWSSVATASTGPNVVGATTFERVYTAMAFDSWRNQAILFGGFDNSNVVNTGDTWARSPASATTFGSGCPAALGPVELQANSLPWLGTTLQLQIDGAPLGLGILVFGLTAQPGNGVAIPGATSCSLLVSPDVSLLCSGTGSTLRHGIPLGTSPVLVGARWYTQAFVLNSAPSALAIGASGGLDLRLDRP